jgi:hypothetical protein
MKNVFAIVLAGLALLMAGCVTTQKPLQLNPQVLESKSARIGVAMTNLPKVDTHFPGASCLLCIAAASAANSSLTTHAQTLPYEDLPKIKSTVADLMRKKGMEVTVIEESIDLDSLDSTSNPGENVSRKDFSQYRSKYKVDRLLVLDINALGFVRTYSAYFATSEPKAYLRGVGYIVNLSNNAYEWYMPVEVTRSADRGWDEPPKFPGLTNAYFQVLEVGKDTFATQFAR